MMKHQLRFWHRWLGILSTLALCWLAITGLLLNHSHDFGIDRKKIHNSFVNQYYGVPESQQEVIAYKLEGDIYYCYAGKLLKNNEIIDDCLDKVKDALVFQKEVFVLTESMLMILSEQGSLLERISLSFFPMMPEGLWVSGEKLFFVFETQASILDLGALVLVASLESEGIVEAYRQSVRQTVPVQSSRLTALEMTGVNLERLLLDAHSGRVFGPWGVYIMDFFALSFIVVAVSGVLIYLRRP